LWMLPSAARTMAQAKPADVDVRACAIFTTAGVSLEAVVTAQKVSITIGTSNTPVSFDFPSGISSYEQGVGGRGCTLVIDPAQAEAAIGIPLAAKTESSTVPTLVDRLDLKRIKWGKPLQLEPPAPLKSFFDDRDLNSFHLLGYKEDSLDDLVLVSSDNRAVLNRQSGETVDLPTNLPNELFGTLTSIDVAFNRFWGSCYHEQKIFGKPEPCPLAATSLFGPPKAVPKVPSPLVAVQRGILQWVEPRFYIDTGRTLIIGGFPASGIHPAHYLWIANLDDSSIRQMTVHSGFNDNSMTGVASLSSDGSVLAFSVAMSKLACCFVDNYISHGDRNVVVDLIQRRQIADVRPPNKKTQLAFAVDHRGTQTVLLVNWGNGWQRKVF
jgi:hypothetical protein